MTKATSDSVIIEMLNTIGRQDGRDEDKKRKTVRQMEKGEKLRKRRKARSDAAGSSDRGGTAASSAMRAEMKGINALNLEPALPNLDDKAPAQKCDADAILGNQNDATKREFKQSLEIIQQRTASKAAKQQGADANDAGTNVLPQAVVVIISKLYSICDTRQSLQSTSESQSPSSSSTSSSSTSESQSLLPSSLSPPSSS